MKIKYINKYYILIFFVLFLEHQCLYLLPQNFKIGAFLYSDIRVIIELCIVIFSIFKFRVSIYKIRGSWIIWWSLLIVFISAFAGVLTYGQSLLTGIIVQRERIASLLMFIPIVTWYKNGKITSEGLWKTLIRFITIYFTICCAQYLLSDKVQFTYSTSSEKIRYGSVRYWFSSTYFVLLAGYMLDNLYKRGNKINIKSVFFILSAFILSFFITKTRMVSLALSTAFVICMLIRRGTLKQKIISICAIFGGIIVFLNTNVGVDLMNTLIGKESLAEDTLTVREMGRKYYIESTSETLIRLIIGCGVASANNGIAYDMTYPHIFSQEYGYSVMLYPQDNGIFGAFYFYGILGIGLWILTLINCFRQAINIYKKTGKEFYLFIIFYEVISCISMLPLMYLNNIAFPIYILLLSIKSTELKSREIKR